MTGSVQYDANTKENYMLDFMTPEMLEAMPSPRTLNSHFHFHHLPAQIKEKKIKFVVSGLETLVCTVTSPFPFTLSRSLFLHNLCMSADEFMITSEHHLKIA